MGAILIMYSRTVTDAQIAKVEAKQHWAFQPHSLSQIDAAIAHFDDLLTDEGEMKRALTPDEKRFVQNERRLSALDFHYYLSRYAYIVAHDNTIQRFIPNVAQQMILDIWGELEEQGKPIMMQQLKARRLGVSTLSELAIAHRTQFKKRTTSIVASADPDKTFLMSKMIDFAWEQQPWWLGPQTTKNVSGKLVEFGPIHSSISYQAGNQFNGIGRGSTPTAVHLSELCEFEDPEDLVDASLMRAILDNPNVIVIMESTALGRGNWWHDTWKLNKDEWPKGRSRVCPIFLPWYCGTDIYPTPTRLITNPIPPDWTPSDLTLKHAERARQYVMTNPLMFRYLAKGDTHWAMSEAQMWFYELERDAAIRKKDLNKFLQEMPSDDFEAFQSTNISVFSPETVLERREDTRQPVAVYTLTGTGIPRDLVAERRLWDLDKPPLVVKASDLLPKAQEVWHLIPLKFEGFSDSRTEASLKLFIWEWPEDGQTYGVGCDTSDGVDQDWSVLEVVRKAFPFGPDEQVAEFASPYIKALQLWPHALCLSALYSTWQPGRNRRIQCRVAIECKGNGESVQWEMLKRGWTNFHPWRKLDNKKPIPIGKAHKIGVFTNAWYRPQMMDRLLTMIEDGSFIPRSPYFVKEMEALEKDEYRQSLKATHGEHDDRIMACGFILDSLHVDDRPYGRDAYARTKFQSPVAEPQTVEGYATYRTPLQATDLPGRGTAIHITGGAAIRPLRKGARPLHTARTTRGW